MEPLRKGLEGKFADSEVVMQEILNWTGGQPFLTQKLCQFMVEESAALRESKVKSQKSENDDSLSVEQVVRSRIIENWELQDEPEHLRTIRSRILRDEERAGYLLDLYQQIHSHEEVVNNESAEQSELLLSGLVGKQQDKLRVYNRIYQEVFNQSWVEVELKKLRPYSEAFRAWVASGFVDESRLLRGNALKGAEEWGKDKNLSYQDKQFLAASREQEIQEEIAAQEKEAQLERERKDREATEERNRLLTSVNIKAKRQIRKGSAVLFLILFVAGILGIFATTEGNKALKAQEISKNAETKAEEANKKFEYANTKAEKEGEKVIAFQQRTQKLQTIANDANQQATQATEKAKEEQRKAYGANQTAIKARQKAEIEQQIAQQSQKNAKDANRQATQAKQQAQVEQRKAEESQKIAYDANQAAKVANQEAESLQNKLALAKKDVENVQKLSQLAGELRNKNLISESDEALRQAGLSFRVNDKNLKQALLLASMSQAYLQLKKSTEAQERITESLKYLQDKGNNITSEEGLQIQVIVKNSEGNLLIYQHKAKAIKPYQQAYNLIKKYPKETNPFKNNQIIATQNIESVHKGLLASLENQNQDTLKKQVWESLKQHFYDELDNLLVNKKWEEADSKTTMLMLYIAKRENNYWLDIPNINNFSCKDLQTINKKWLNASNNMFGFSLQKDIWIEETKKKGLDFNNLNYEELDRMDEAYKSFATRVGWYDKELQMWMIGNDKYIMSSDAPSRLKSLGIRGKLPLWRFQGAEGWESIGKEKLHYGGSEFFSRVASCNL